MANKFLLPLSSWLVLVWLLVYIPVYATSYGFWHFMQLCNLGVLISCMGFLLRNAFLISSQAIATPVIALFWLADFLSQCITGHFIHGGTAYMWNGEIPLITRLLSLYHLFLPVLLISWLAKNGYEKNSWKLQAAIAVSALLLGLFIAPSVENLNYVYHWPGGRILYGQPILHAMLSLSILLVFVYWPTHRVLLLAFSKTK